MKMYKLFIKKFTSEIIRLLGYVFSLECVINALLILIAIFVNDNYFMIEGTLEIMAYGYFTFILSNEIAEKVAPSNKTSGAALR